MFLDGQLRPTHPKVVGPQRSPILGFPSTYAYTLCHRTTKFDVVTHVGGEGRVSWGQPCVPSQDSGEPPKLGNPGTPLTAEFHGSPILGVLLYLSHLLSQNYQIQHGKTYGEGRILGQPCHCICTNASRGLSATAIFLVIP